MGRNQLVVRQSPMAVFQDWRPDAERARLFLINVQYRFCREGLKTFTAACVMCGIPISLSSGLLTPWRQSHAWQGMHDGQSPSTRSDAARS